MRRVFFLLILILIVSYFVFAQFDMSVPVTDSQLKAVNSALDLIQTTLTEHLKNIDLNLYNLLRIQYEDFFKRNYQNKILQLWSLKYQLEDYNTLLKTLSDPTLQNEKLEEFRKNAELAGAYKTVNSLSSIISCVPGDYRYLLEEYVSAIFSYYDLATSAKDQISFIPDCEDIGSAFSSYIISYSQPGRQNNFLTTILKPFSFGRLLLAAPPSISSPGSFSFTPAYKETFDSIAFGSAQQTIDYWFNYNVELYKSNLPDPRNVNVPGDQAFTDSGEPITLSYKPLLDFPSILLRKEQLDSHIRSVLGFDPYNYLISTSSLVFSTSTIKEECDRITINSNQGGNVSPQIACAEALKNVSVDINEKILAIPKTWKSLTKLLSQDLEESSKKVDNLQASTTPECEKINERLQEIKEKIDNKLNHYATVTIDVDRVISVLTNNKIKINQTVQRISSTRATINKKYEDIVSNVNEILKIFKQKTIESGPLFRGLPLDFLGSIIKSLKGHNALLILNKTDEVVNNLNQILADADSIANTVGISTNVFNDLRSQLMKGARPLTESIFVKDSFELYGIKLEIANLENEINQGCPNKRRTAYLNNNLKNYAYNNSKNYNLVSKSKININEAKVNNQNFILTLMANIFSKIVNLR